MRLRIESDGTVGGTRVHDGQGVPIAGVKRIIWEIDVKSGLSVATIVLHEVRLSADANDANVAYEPDEEGMETDREVRAARPGLLLRLHYWLHRND